MLDTRTSAPHHPKMPPSDTSIPWDKVVEFFHSGPDLQVARAHLTLRDAVEHFLTLPHDEQEGCGIGIHEAIVKLIEGRPATLGFLRPNAIRTLAERL